jgi:ribonuclease J
MNSNQNDIKFIIHRGSHQIGGNCVELATRNARIVIDCGLPLDYDEQDVETQNEIRENAQKWLQNCDAVFLSHYHADHYGLLNEAPQGTKVYATKETAELMKISGMFGEDLTEYLDIQPIEDTVTVKDFRVTKYDVDHSAFGACAFLFEVCGKRILYSGDIRLHGKKGVLYKNLPQNVDYLFLEGTNLGRGVRQKTETAIENEFVKQFSSNPDSLHFVWCSSQNIDRIVALYRACVRTNRVLGVDPYAAYALELAHQNRQSIPNKTFPSLEIYFPWSFTNWMIEKDRQLVLDLRRGATKLDQTDLPVNPSKYVLLYRPKLIGDLNRYISKTKVCLTNSIWAQYWEQDKSEINRLKAWIEDKPELRQKLPDIHTSGHADVASLQKIVDHIQPKRIIPIHTEHSESFSTLFPKDTVLEVEDEVCYSMDDPTIWKSTQSFEDLDLGFYMTHVIPDFEHIVITVFFKNPGVSPRIMLTNNTKWYEWTDERTVSITLSKTPVVIGGDEREIPAEAIEKAKEWVVLNYEVLMKHWDGETDSLTLLKNLKKI